MDLCWIPAPWHAGGLAYEGAGIKWMSYAPNMLATWRANDFKADDALLTSREGTILEGPTFAVAWARKDGVWETPDTKNLGILPSVTHALATAAGRTGGLQFVEGKFSLAHLRSVATELVALSSTRDVMPVSKLVVPNFDARPDPATGLHPFETLTFPSGPHGKRLGALYYEHILRQPAADVLAKRA